MYVCVCYVIGGVVGVGVTETLRRVQYYNIIWYTYVGNARRVQEIRSGQVDCRSGRFFFFFEFDEGIRQV